MDVNGFREAQSPFFFTQPPQTLVETRVKSVAVATKTTAPTGDNRYPGYAAMMSDGPSAVAMLEQLGLAGFMVGTDLAVYKTKTLEAFQA